MMVVIESEEDLIAIIYAAAQRGKLLEAQNKRLAAERDALAERVRLYQEYYDAAEAVERGKQDYSLVHAHVVRVDAARAAIEQGD